ncbi:peptidoglycan DD-metalloendopeptidase family protein [Nitritalea halalkaliphila]|uniref:peptidoglycan DD-metalloendopeptidase family protein n=1 Tax=Nitritalea halalkaliphila TaxID=590849 RepID=UPI0002FFF050
MGRALYFYLAYRACGPNSEALIDEIEEETEEIIETVFGFLADEFEVLEGTVAKNQTLGALLSPLAVPYEVIDRLAKNEAFDVRKIAYNKKFTVLSARDTAKPRYFIYEPNALEYVVFDLEEAIVYKEEKPVAYETREIGGSISSNLYVNMTALGGGPDLVDQFADLYGWVVDFQRLQKGDAFKVVYSEKVVDGQPVGIGEIQAAYFEHMGEPYHAIPFEQEGELNFFDAEGNSLKKAFLRDPLKYTRISSRYNLNRYHPVQKRYKPHLGTDYAAPTGTEIRSVGDGTVVEARFTSANGNYVKIKHNATYTTQYLHMSKFAAGMKPAPAYVRGRSSAM